MLRASEMNSQAPPNLSARSLRARVDAGINDWGGVSPVTPDHVNPEAPWPHLQVLERATNAAFTTTYTNSATNAWLAPTVIMTPRFMDIGVQVNF